MIPYTFPSVLKEDGTTACRVRLLTDVTGLVTWTDYTPIKFEASNSFVNTYANGGTQAVQIETDFTGLVSGIDFIEVFVDVTATKPFSTDFGGFIPCFGGPLSRLMAEDGFFLLQENGSSLLQENGFKLSSENVSHLLQEDEFFILLEN